MKVMDSSKISMSTTTEEAKQDLISNLPAIATDKILKHLPIKMAAKMSVLSRKWRDNWLSQKHLVLDKTFWERDNHGISKTFWEIDKREDKYGIISSILFHHNGNIHEFHLFLPQMTRIKSIHLSQWLSFLSKTNTEKLALINSKSTYIMPISSHIYLCKELLKLRLEHLALNPPPRYFNGFMKLQSLELYNITFKNSSMIASLIAGCPRLIVLKLLCCSFNLDHLTIDLPSLESLVISVKRLGCLCFKSIVSLNNISLCLDKRPESHPTVLNSIRDLATSCQLQYLHFGGHLCEHLAAGGVTKSLPLSFNYLSKLCLTTIKINRVNVYHFAIGMVKSCPRIKDLEILIRNEGKAVIQHEIDFDYRIDSYKLGHLTKVEFTGITGTIAELKFIEYLLAVSEVLELFLFKCNNLDATSELKLSRDLLRLRRASTKAQLICMEQHRI
ncbi:putative FBD-associated F-box protein At1g55030 isoform X2 [Chenopodium quinoa]|nr:putative FBD-associated F-box protein At1g55030 isoform X2 [Chenopodium quinoa]